MQISYCLVSENPDRLIMEDKRFVASVLGTCLKSLSLVARYCMSKTTPWRVIARALPIETDVFPATHAARYD